MSTTDVSNTARFSGLNPFQITTSAKSALDTSATIDAIMILDQDEKKDQDKPR